MTWSRTIRAGRHASVWTGRLVLCLGAGLWAPVAAQQVPQAIEVVPLNVCIEVQFKTQEQKGDRGGAISGSGRSWPSPQGQTTRFNLKPRANDVRSTETESVRQILLVASGCEGSLRVSESVPYLEWFHDYGMRSGLIRSRILWQKVGAYLTVQPEVIGLGPQIRIRITPELRGLVDRNPLRIRYTTVTTEVIVNDGETLNLGGLIGNRDFYGHFLVGFDQANQERTLDITLTPRLNRGR